MTKARTPSAIIPKSPARFNHQISYQGSEHVRNLPEFTSGSRSFTIGVKRSSKVTQSIGPGYYDPNESLVKHRPSSALISQSPARFQNGKANDNCSFGEGGLPDFTDGSKPFTIGVRRPGMK